MPVLSPHSNQPRKIQVEASEAYNRASLSRNRRLPACYRSDKVYNTTGEEEDEDEEDVDHEEE